MLDGFVKIDGIEGESTDDKHSGGIEISSFSSGVVQKKSFTASSAGGASAERADFREFVITKEADKSSPKLALARAGGTHIDSITAELCRAGGDKVKIFEYKMTNCLISRVAAVGGSGIPMETVHINFGKIEWIYTQQTREGGGPAGQVAAGWNLEKKCKV